VNGTASEDIRGRRVRVTREVTAKRSTREWTGCRIWEGTVTDGSLSPTSAGTRGVCVLTRDEHTWLALGTWEDKARRWVTVLEFV
jgi:hypothetical protein